MHLGKIESCFVAWNDVEEKEFTIIWDNPAFHSRISSHLFLSFSPSLTEEARKFPFALSLERGYRDVIRLAYLDILRRTWDSPLRRGRMQTIFQLLRCAKECTPSNAHHCIQHWKELTGIECGKIGITLAKLHLLLT